MIVVGSLPSGTATETGAVGDAGTVPLDPAAVSPAQEAAVPLDPAAVSPAQEAAVPLDPAAVSPAQEAAVPLDPAALAELLERFEVKGETLAAMILRLAPSGDIAAPFISALHGMYSDLAITAAQCGSVVAPGGQPYAVPADWPWQHRDPYP